jgi:hypothetical protein
VRDITSLITKLLYCVRTMIFMKLIKRNERDEGEIRIDKDLDELRIYIRDLIQSPFGFLREMMHLTAHIAGDNTYLPQICWFEENEYTSLIIRGKKVELSELKNLCRELLKKAETQLHSRVKMGVSGSKCEQ